MALHANEPPIDVALVERLLAAQFPQYAHVPITRFDSPGTTNAIYRIGANLMARLPMRTGGVEELHKSFTWLPRFAPQVSVSTPPMGPPGIPRSAWCR